MSFLSHRKGLPIYALIILLGFAFTIYWRIDPGIICFLQESVPDTIGDGFHRVGGVNHVIAMHIISLFNFKTAGTLVFLALAGVFFLSLSYLFSDLKSHPYFPAGIFTIALALLFPLFDYPYSFIHTSSIILSTCLIIPGYFVAQKMRTLRWVPVTVILLLIYYLFGVPGFYLSCIVVIAHPSIPKNQKLLYAILVITIPSLSMVTGLTYTFKQAYFEPFISTIYYRVKAAGYAIYLLTLLVIILLRITKNKVSLQNPNGGTRIIHRLFQYGIPILLSTAVLNFSFDKRTKEIYQIEYYAQQKNWQGILENARHVRNVNSTLLHFQINRALYHQGYLLERLFHYPQPSGTEGLFLDNSTDGTIAQPKADFYFDMGYGNESRHFANEALTARGHKPHTLKCLIINYAAADQYVIASRYWNLLNKSIAHKQWCKDHAALLDGETDSDIQRLKENFPEEDFFTGLARPENKLKRFYFNNTQNRMAFEYLIANYLINHKLGNIAHDIATFRQLGYTRLPRLVEEAILIYLTRANVTDFDLSGYEISKEAQQDFKDFSVTIQKAGGIANGKSAVQHYNHTFWYYIIYSSRISRTENQ